MTPPEAIMLGCVSLCIAAPLVAAAAVRLLGERISPRLPAATAIGVSLAAACGLAAVWHSTAGRPFLFGPRLAGAVDALAVRGGAREELLRMVDAIVTAEAVASPCGDARPCTVDWVARAKRKHRKKG